MQFSPLIIIALIALVQATFQLSVSMVTLLSSHAVGRKKSQRQLNRLTASFSSGAFVMTLLLLSMSGLILSSIFSADTRHDLFTWTIFCGLAFGLGISVWVFYYRKEAGTKLWIPRGMARYLSERAKKTAHPAEAFGLGMSSVIGEILFILIPIIIAGAFLLQLEPALQLIGVLLYALVASSSLVFVTVSITAGRSISRIQKWRETNKQFLQFAAGSGLIVLGFYLYVDQVVSTSAFAAAGGL